MAKKARKTKKSPSKPRNKKKRSKVERKPPTQDEQEDDFMGVSDIHKVDPSRLKRKPRRGTKYAPIFDQMVRLGPGESFTVLVREGVSPRDMHNRINAALARVEIEPPEGCTFVKRTTVDGNIEIICTRVE